MAAEESTVMAAAEKGRKVRLEWEERVVTAVPAATADEAWALLSDFLAFHRWHPRGTPRADGLPPDWAHETLLEHDAARRFFRYEMNDNNMGFGVFFATFRVVPAAAGPGCELRWEFECEPVRGTPKEALVARLQAGLDGMAARVQEHLRGMNDIYTE
ncbi:hypothetical protein E2562_000594 [Oryza meyeriana var. granulata]|uniref:Uncharacterized protein n=1 Tax=Oryza meyeriana var. granulata TaxID=110450 RepID=A0A6G1DTK0_9ORYZ|nr:hypothetical protein E2562_000594 [Oryza meyeriana var. granulata]